MSSTHAVGLSLPAFQQSAPVAAPAELPQAASLPPKSNGGGIQPTASYALSTAKYQLNPAYRQFFDAGLNEPWPTPQPHGWWCRHLQDGKHKPAKPVNPSPNAYATQAVEALEKLTKGTYTEMAGLNQSGEQAIAAAKDAIRAGNINDCTFAVQRYIDVLDAVDRLDVKRTTLTKCQAAVVRAAVEKDSLQTQQLALQALRGLGMTTAAVEAQQNRINQDLDRMDINSTQLRQQRSLDPRVSQIVASLAAEVNAERAGQVVMPPAVIAAQPVQPLTELPSL